ncbi:ABC transporter permease [Actinospica robiniae]|uniref:ABC transporter permease n=1 Tax=Actinospica robiniae TaxID=304901 RepID=UPI0004092E52|nr:ABC transporter permease [Actinospica robiniae]
MTRDAQVSPARYVITGPPLPSALRLGLSRSRLELTQYFRQRDAVVFTFGYPLIMLVIFGSIFSGDVQGTNIPYVQYFTAGITATGVMSIGFQNTAVAIASDRTDLAIKRLRGLPMPELSYFLGKLFASLVEGAMQTALLIACSIAFFHVHLPANGEDWVTLLWVFTLGLATCAALGILLGGWVKDGRTASAVTLPPFLVLQFVSGVFFPFNELSPVLRSIGALFPLKWMCQGLRSVFLPNAALVAEPAHSWQRPETAVVLAVWLVAALLLALRTFRWKEKYEN